MPGSKRGLIHQPHPLPPPLPARPLLQLCGGAVYIRRTSGVVYYCCLHLHGGFKTEILQLTQSLLSVRKMPYDISKVWVVCRRVTLCLRLRISRSTRLVFSRT